MIGKTLCEVFMEEKSQSMQLKHSYPLSPAANGSRLWQFVFDTPQGEKRETAEIPVAQDEFEQAALVRAALAIVRATL